MKIAIKIILVILAIFVLFKIGVASGSKQLEKINSYEECILDQYDMSSTEYYQLTGNQPVCRTIESSEKN